MNDSIKGFSAGILAAVTYGLNPLFGIHLYRNGMTTYSILFYRFMFAAVMLAGFMYIRKKSFHLPKYQFFHVAIGGVLLALSCLTWFWSFKVMDSGIGASIMFMYPIMVATIMAFGFHEKITSPILTGILLALAGVAVLCCPDVKTAVNAEGVICVIISALAYSVYIVEVKESRLKELSPETLTFYVMLFGGIVFMIPLKMGVELQMLPGWRAFGNALGVAFFPSFLSFLLMAVAIRHIGATQTAILGALEPVTAVCIGVFVFSESLTWRSTTGIGLILTSVMVVVWGGNRLQRKTRKPSQISEGSI